MKVTIEKGYFPPPFFFDTENTLGELFNTAASGYLRAGLFPLYRMSTVYAGVRSFCFPPDTVMAANVCVGILAHAWVGTGAGLAEHANAALIAGTTQHPHGSSLNWSFQALGLLAAVASYGVILHRRQTIQVVSERSPAARAPSIHEGGE